MFYPAAAIAAMFGDHLAETYLKAFPQQKPQYSDFLKQIAREVLVHIGTCDAPYHNSEHTMMVTLAGQQILQGKKKTSTVCPEDWLHFIVALLLHDIGFVRSVCEGDMPNEVVINNSGVKVTLPRGASDASLGPYHVDRGKIYARQRFADSEFIDPERIAQAIEYTRFPVPDDSAYTCLDTEPALVRAADLIGQIADPAYFSKIGRLFHELVETGVAYELGINSSRDLVERFPDFFHQQVEPIIGPALEHLRQTRDGQELIMQLYNRVSQVLHGEVTSGPFSGQ